ncbi:SRPBCC family protein [Actinomadura fibrosa]|uniref:SRPBCC family protein n=1 Tax=Actinomadura fibrosa TaxID=111802 RepID=A0ABW2Y310_9ACTN|nr:SRPBCC family protein [Actinomadura fibrosa]
MSVIEQIRRGACGAGVRPSARAAGPAAVVVERTIAASPEALYAMVGEVSEMARWSPETARCRWIPPATGPAAGARFRGVNRRGRRRWSTTCTVTAAEPGRRFEFEVRAAGLPISRWLYTFRAEGAGCRVTERWTDLRPVWAKPLSLLISGVADRTAHNRLTMEATLAALAEAAEDGPETRP